MIDLEIHKKDFHDDCIDGYKAEIERLFPEIDLNNKYCLFIMPVTYFKHSIKNIKVSFTIHYMDRDKDIKTIVRYPYPNRNYKSLAMKVGRKTSKLGIPLVFNSLEELNTIKAIEISWMIEPLTSGTNQKVKSTIHSIYEFNNKFVKEDQHVYSLYCLDLDFINIEQGNFGEYKNVIVGTNNNQDAMTIRDVKGYLEESDDFEKLFLVQCDIEKMIEYLKYDGIEYGIFYLADASIK